MIMNQKVLNESGFFRSSDLALVVALSLFFPVEAIDKEPMSGKAYFLFRKDGKDFEKILQQYWSRELRIEPQTFFNQMKVIKARIYSKD